MNGSIKAFIGLVALMQYASEVSADELEQVRKGIEDRAAGFETVDITWKVTTHISLPKKRAGAVDTSDPFGGGPISTRLAASLPVKLEWEARLRCAGNKLRLDYNRPVRDYGRDGFTPRPLSIAYDGRVVKRLEFQDGQPFPHRGQISGPPFHSGDSAGALPLHWHVGGFTHTGRLDRNFFAGDLDVAPAQLDGQDTLRIQRNKGTKNEATVWLNLQRGYSLVQFLELRNGQPDLEVRVDKFQEVAGHSLPQTWTTKAHQWMGQFDATSKCKVVQAVVNEPIDSSVFEMPLPRGAVLWDERGEERQLVVIGDGQREFQVVKQQFSGVRSAEEVLRILEAD